MDNKISNGKETSDEKLLKLIEGATPAGRPQKSGIKQKQKGKGIIQLFLRVKQFKFKFNLATINRGALILCGLLTLFFLYNFSRQTRVTSADLIFPGARAGKNKAAEDAGGFLPKETYLDEISKHNVFLPIEQRSSATAASETAVANIVKDLKLVGVIWASNPEVMIENTKEKKTHLLGKGQLFGEQQIKVKQIYKNMVVLEIPIGSGIREYELR